METNMLEVDYISLDWLSTTLKPVMSHHISVLQPIVLEQEKVKVYS